MTATLPKVGGRRSLRAFALLAAILGLAACAAQPKRASPLVPPPAKTAKRAPAVPVPGTVVFDPLRYEQDKNRIKRALANNPQHSLPPTETGYYMDVLHGRLKQLAGKDLAVGRHDDRIILVMALGFDSGSARIDPAIGESLTPLSKVLVEYRKTLVSLHIGDDAAERATHPPLADQRAQAVARYLVKAGVAVKRIVIAGSGVNRPPVADTGLENRTRVELQIEPIVRAAGVDR